MDKDQTIEAFECPVEGLESGTTKCVTVAVMGAGSRGNEYPSYGKLFPGTLKVVAVADINRYRREKMAAEWGIAPEHVFGDYHEMLAAGRQADVLLVALPDDLHYEPAMAAMLQGYDILLEKPMAQTEEECRALLARQRETGVMVAVGHVLRYSPYSRAMKYAIDSGVLGEVVNIQHQEPVMFAHMAHSFVRGNWRDSKATTPMILAKTCHDLDILKWMIGKHCESIACEGSTALFRHDRRPADAPARCTDGCPHEAECPYSALDIYVRRKWFRYVFDIPRDAPDEVFAKELETSPYGRCVYACDNDQPDHLVATLRFEGGVTASFTMDAFTPWGGRRTRVMGTLGYLEGDGTTFDIHVFRSGRRLHWEFKAPEGGNYKDSGHAGGDLALVRDFLRAVTTRDEKYLSSSLAASVESHVIGFAGERSRKSENEKVKVKDC